MSAEKGAPGWYPVGNGQQMYWNGFQWTGDRAPWTGPESPPKPAVDIGKAIGGVGCLMVLAVLAFLAFGAWRAGNSSDDALQNAWNRLSPTAQQAYCGSIQRDPSFDGSAVGLAAMAGNGVTQYDAKQFLFDHCPVVPLTP